MRFSIDLDTLVATPATFTVKRGDRFPVQVRFSQGGVGQELPNAATGKLVIKVAKDYAGPMVAGSAEWRKVGRGAGAYYVFQLSLATDAVAEAFADGAGELAQVGFVMEIEWAYRGVRQTSKTVAFTVENDYSRSGDSMPVDAG